MPTEKERQLENVKKLLENPDALDGFLRVFKPVIPQGLVVRVQKMMQEKRVDPEVTGELTKVVVDYHVKLYDPSLWKDEKVLWGHNEFKSDVGSKPWRTWAVTNHRAFVYDHTVESFETVAGLPVSDVDVVNEHTKDQDVCIGAFSEAGKTLMENAMVSLEESHQTCGDVVFARGGTEKLRFHNVNDPKNVKKLVETVQKQKKLLRDQSEFYSV